MANNKSSETYTTGARLPLSHPNAIQTTFNMNRVNLMTLNLRNPETAKAIEEERNNVEPLSEPGEINPLDLMMVRDQNTLKGINRRRKQLREVKLRDYKISAEDADTLVLKKKGSLGSDISIRLSGIDAPETSHANDPFSAYKTGEDQPLGDRSTDRLKEILGDKKDLRLIVDPSQRTYGRYLGLIYKGNQNINLQLVEEGHASSLEFGSKYRDIASRSAFMAAGDKAEREGVGIWGNDFFKDWKAFSAGTGKDVTFNSFTDLLRLGRNKHLAAGAAEMWEDGVNEEESYRQGALYQISNQFSGKDGSYNSINAMKHGWFGKQRKETTEFGSGYKGPKLRTEHEDPTPVDTGRLGAIGGTVGGAAYFWNKDVSLLGYKPQIDNLSYFGLTSERAGRTSAKYKDLVYNGLRRVEMAFGGIPKAFSLSTMMSPSVLKDSTFTVDLANKAFNPLDGLSKGSKAFQPGVGYGYKEYLMSLTGIDKKTFNTFSSVTFDKGKLYGETTSGARSLLLKEARLLHRIHDPNQTKSVAQFAKSYEHIFNMAGVGAEHEFLIAGGKNKAQAAMRGAHAFGHETLSKYLRLVDDPMKAFQELFPNLSTTGKSSKVTKALNAISGIMPGFGVGGEKNLIGTLPTLLGRHATRALPLLIGIPAAFGTLNWLTRQIAPEDSVAGKAGLTGIAAESARLAHMTYARVSEATGLTDLREYGEERAPGITGLKPWLGFVLSGAITGTALGMATGALKEAKASAGVERYNTMINAKMAQDYMPDALRKIPTMSGKYTRAIKWGKYGGLAMGALALPFLLTGIGSDKTVAELDEEYLGGKEVAIKKARWWEFGVTPWEGGRTMYYRPNWYNRTLDRPSENSIYDGEDISPIGKFARSLADPYWLEKAHYEDRPYPVAGSSGEHLGIFGPLYEATIGRVMKPPAYMHPEVFAKTGYREKKSKYDPSPHIEGSLGPEEAITPYSLTEQAKQQYSATYEAMGLRGFTASAIKQAITGEQELFEQTPILQSSADIDSARRSYWDLNLGGMLGLTEPYRRFTPKRPYTTEIVNPIKNKMPDWLPGEDYFLNLQTGDPFTKLPEGEYRLPGKGYATRFKELEGVSPEKYPLIHKYKILADVAPYSKEFRSVRKELEDHDPTSYELDIFTETEKQLEDKRRKKRFRDDVYNESVLGRYGAALIDVARANPLEQLTPLAPAHKFLPPATAMQSYEESIYGKEFKLWQRPLDDFVKPFINTASNLLGADGIPQDIKDARQIESYFDRLEYAKNKRLEMSAHGRGAEGRAKAYRKAAGNTLIGADVYSNEFRLMAALPKREKVYFEQFKQSSSEDKTRILEIAPDGMKDLYIAQWDKQLLQDMQEGKLNTTQEENKQIEKEVFNRMTTVRARRQAEEEAVMRDDSLPKDDWIGWRADVDMEDIKLKYLIQTGRDHHYYNLWDDRLRGLRRKPYLEEATEGLYPMDKDRPDITYQEVYKKAIEAGIRNPEIIQRNSHRPTVSYDLEYNHNTEIYNELRNMSAVI